MIGGGGMLSAVRVGVGRFGSLLWGWKAVCIERDKRNNRRGGTIVSQRANGRVFRFILVLMFQSELFFSNDYFNDWGEVDVVCPVWPSVAGCSFQEEDVGLVLRRCHRQ